MAFCSYTCKVNCFFQRPSVPSKVEDLKDSISSALKPFSRDLVHFSIVADIPKAVKETSIKLLDAFVDSVFEFVDQPLLPSQVHDSINYIITTRFNNSCKLELLLLINFDRVILHQWMKLEKLL
uniref:Uncharacterized protein n=1 Tax=Solanum lycopersicum TaxID=4081 RepID=A0A3Q7HR21_SOLLC